MAAEVISITTINKVSLTFPVKILYHFLRKVPKSPKDVYWSFSKVEKMRSTFPKLPQWSSWPPPILSFTSFRKLSLTTCTFSLYCHPFLPLHWVSLSLPVFPHLVYISFTPSSLFHVSTLVYLLNLLPRNQFLFVAATISATLIVFVIPVQCPLFWLLYVVHQRRDIPIPDTAIS